MRRHTVTVFLVWLVLTPTLGVAGRAEHQPHPALQPIADRLLVLNKLDDNLMVFEAPNRQPIATLTVGDEPHEIAVTPDGRKAYVSNVGDRSITVIDLESLGTRGTIRPARADFPHGLAITPDGELLVLTSERSHRLYLIETRRDVLLRSVTSTQEGMHMVAMPARGRRAYVSNRGSDSISFINVKRLSFEKHVPVGPGPEGIAVTPDGRLLLVALQRADEVVILKQGSGAVLARLPTGRTPVRVAITPDSRTAVIANRDSDNLTIIDLEERTVRGTVPVGDAPGGIVTTPTNDTVYVCNNGSNSVSIVSVTDLRVTGELTVGAHPDGIAFVPGRSAGETTVNKPARKKRRPK